MPITIGKVAPVKKGEDSPFGVLKFKAMEKTGEKIYAELLSIDKQLQKRYNNVDWTTLPVASKNNLEKNRVQIFEVHQPGTMVSNKGEDVKILGIPLVDEKKRVRAIIEITAEFDDVDLIGTLTSSQTMKITPALILGNSRVVNSEIAGHIKVLNSTIENYSARNSWVIVGSTMQAPVKDFKKYQTLVPLIYGNMGFE